MRIFVPLAKFDEEQRLAIGYASTPALDSQGEIVKREAVEAALPDYMRFANIREMHQPSAVGVAQEADLDARGLRIAAKVVDDDAWEKVKQGVYKGFSIGGRVTARDPADRRVITGLDLTEISLVDRPANPEAVIDVYKAVLAKEGRRNNAADQKRIQHVHTTHRLNWARTVPTRRPRLPTATPSPTPTIPPRRFRATISPSTPVSPSVSMRWRAKSRRSARC